MAALAPHKPTRILCIQTAFLGDAFLAIPLLRAIRIKFPESEIQFLCRRGVGEFFKKTNLVDEILEVSKSSKASLNHTYKEALKSQQIFKPELIVSAHRSLRTALFVHSLRSGFKVGYKSPFTFWAYNRRIKRNRADHDVLRQLALFNVLVQEGLCSPLNREEKEQVLNSTIKVENSLRFACAKGAVALAPGSQWTTKRWGERKYVDLAVELAQRKSSIVLVGGPEEVEMAVRIQKEAQQKASHAEILNFAGQTSVYELSQLLSECRVLVSNDSGAMHVAACVGTPVVSIFGPTVPEQGYTPWIKSSTIIETPLNCRPCGAHGHKACPLKHHKCMEQITPMQVLMAVESFLK